MKRKLVILITILLISTSLLSCKDPYEGAIVGANLHASISGEIVAVGSSIGIRRR